MITEPQRTEINRLWERKLAQDAQQLPNSQRHRNLQPVSAEFICSLAAGIGAGNLLEIGGSSGVSTIALAAAAQATQGKLISLEIEPNRQAEARKTIDKLGLTPYVDFHLGDAAAIVPQLTGLDFVFIDCEKEDYVRFFDMLHMRPGGIVVADNILSHDLREYVTFVRSFLNARSITLPIGQGLEITTL